MKLSATYLMQFRRRREGKTNYRKRLKLLLSRKLRLVVRKSNKYIRAHLAEYEEKGDKTLIFVFSKVLRKYGWKFSCKNLPACYLTGFLLGKKALKAGIKEAILDIGLYPSTKGSRIYAVAKGAKDAGLEIPIGEKVLPSEERIEGQHIANFREKFKDIIEEFKKVKQKILEEYG